jgi:predicted alpha-1,2-mannosidase
MVHVMAGTNTADGSAVSEGNTLPQIKMPWGFNDWAPQTDGYNGAWWFHRDDKSFQGMRCTHQPSPWIGDYGNFVLQPHIGDEPKDLEWSSADSVIRPYLFNATLEDIGFEFVPTSHAAIVRVSPAKSAEALHLSISTRQGEIQSSSGELRGRTTSNSGGVPGNWIGMYFIVRALSSGTKGDWVDDQRGTLAFENTGKPIIVAMATSFISQEQAERNLELEIGSRSFDDVLEAGRATWAQQLGRVRVEALNDNQLAVFYTNLWKSMLFPRYLQEVDADGKEVHRSPYTGDVRPGKLVADSGFWDSYRTVYQLQSMVFPDNLGGLIDGWVDAYQEATWLPEWASPGQHASMVGTMGDVTLADAIAKSRWGFLKGFDVDKAYEAIRKDAFSEPEGLFGRAGLDDYVEKGYVTADVSESVSRTMNYYVSDAAIARAAGILGKHEDEKVLSARSKRYDVIFNNSTKFFQPKDSQGNFLDDFNPISWGNGFTEAGAWQYRFYLPHDVEGLEKLYHGKLCQNIQAMMTHVSGQAYDVGSYGNDIHEMMELAAIHQDFGLYAHNNQPVHHVLYVAKKAGCNSVADKYLRKVMNKLYTTNGWAGDEDNGEMASWYVLSALGIYSLEGAKDEIVLGSPAVKHASVQLPNNKVVQVETEDQSDHNVYVQSVTWTPIGGSSRVIAKNVMRFTELMRGGKLLFRMGPSPKHAPRQGRLRARAHQHADEFR